MDWFLIFFNGILGILGAKPLSLVVCRENQRIHSEIIFGSWKFEFWIGKIGFWVWKFVFWGRKFRFWVRKFRCWKRKILSWVRKNGFLQWKFHFCQTFLYHVSIFKFFPRNLGNFGCQIIVPGSVSWKPKNSFGNYFWELKIGILDWKNGILSVKICILREKVPILS